MKTAQLDISKIRCDSGTQSRVSINDDVVADYAERMLAGDKFPPVDVFFDGTEYHAADGFHRILAANRNKAGKIECAVHTGTATDALWFAIGSNKLNGVRMSATDKRHAIGLALAKFPDKTQEAIAEHVGCTRQYVSAVQRELASSCKFTPPKTRKGKDGKSRPTKYRAREAAGEMGSVTAKAIADAARDEASPADDDTIQGDPPEEPERPHIKTADEELRQPEPDEVFGRLHAARVRKCFRSWAGMAFPKPRELEWALSVIASDLDEWRKAL